MTLGITLGPITLAKGRLLHHLSRTIHQGKPLHFGAHGNRYDDPAGQYGVLYLAPSLATGLMETVFHNHTWLRKRRLISTAEVAVRMVRIVAAQEELRLADLTARGVMAGGLSLNLSQLVSRRYRHTQALSALIHRTTDFDGIYYPSRNDFPSTCIALFDRACGKVAVAADIGLAFHTDWPCFCRDYRVLQTA